MEDYSETENLIFDGVLESTKFSDPRCRQDIMHFEDHQKVKMWLWKLNFDKIILAMWPDASIYTLISKFSIKSYRRNSLKIKARICRLIRAFNLKAKFYRN
jgi:hypothetical protein